MALGDLVGTDGGLDVVEEGAALGAEPTPIAVVFAADAGASGRLVHVFVLFMRDEEKQNTAEAPEEKRAQARCSEEPCNIVATPRGGWTGIVVLRPLFLENAGTAVGEEASTTTRTTTTTATTNPTRTVSFLRSHSSLHSSTTWGALLRARPRGGRGRAESPEPSPPRRPCSRSGTWGRFDPSRRHRTCSPSKAGGSHRTRSRLRRKGGRGCGSCRAMPTPRGCRPVAGLRTRMKFHTTTTNRLDSRVVEMSVEGARGRCSDDDVTVAPLIRRSRPVPRSCKRIISSPVRPVSKSSPESACNSCGLYLARKLNH